MLTMGKRYNKSKFGKCSSSTKLERDLKENLLFHSSANDNDRILNIQG